MKNLKRHWSRLELKPTLLAITLIFLTFLLSLILFPSLQEVIYDNFLWRFIVGPVVADWQGQAVSYHGVMSYPGYNLVNTVVYALAGLLIFYSIYKLLTRYGIKLNNRFFFSALPLIIFGGLARAGEDVGITGRLGPLFITPVIYLIIAGWALLLIFIAQRWQLDLNRLFIGSGLTLIGVYSAVLVLTVGVIDPNFGQLTTILTLAALPAAASYAFGRVLSVKFLTKASYITILFGHLLDASQSYVGMHSGYTEKMVLPHLLTSLTGPYAIFFLKLGLVLPILYLLDKETAAKRLDSNFKVLFMLAVIALGLPQGIRGGLRILLGA